jgi:hypothetical protein
MTRKHAIAAALITAGFASVMSIEPPEDDGYAMGCTDAYASDCTPDPTNDDDFTEPDLPALCDDALNHLKDGGVWTVSGGTETVQVGALIDGYAEVALSGACYDMAPDGPDACRLAGEGHSIEVKIGRCNSTGCVIAVDAGEAKFYEPAT